MKTKYLFLFTAAVMIVLSSCGAKKKLQEAENRYSSLDSNFRMTQQELAQYKDSVSRYRNENERLSNLLQDQKSSNN